MEVEVQACLFLHVFHGYWGLFREFAADGREERREDNKIHDERNEGSHFGAVC